eukprot:TRINITY_DN1723_c0_g1_i3.p1 TRINITY_DN1723_c0_g1~~TRINITY_DN1723_c0_g1_i3.p1  ORF type:complete len:120 (-),score=21.54 TRINITY_DN1723_c0_g1_i3:114-473(-)
MGPNTSKQRVWFWIFLVLCIVSIFGIAFVSYALYYVISTDPAGQINQLKDKTQQALVNTKTLLQNLRNNNIIERDTLNKNNEVLAKTTAEGISSTKITNNTFQVCDSPLLFDDHSYCRQ